MDNERVAVELVRLAKALVSSDADQVASAHAKMKGLFKEYNGVNINLSKISDPKYKNIINPAKKKLEAAIDGMIDALDSASLLDQEG